MRPLATALLLATAPFAGSCAKSGDLGAIRDYLPKVRFHRFDVTGITFEKVDTVFVVEIDNPYPVGIDFGSFRWSLRLAGNDFLSGDDDQGSRIKPGGTSKVRIPVTLGFQQIVQTVQDLQGADEVPFGFSGSVGLKTPVGPIQLPFRTKGEIPVLKAPKIAFQKVRLDRVDVLGGKATIAIDLGLTPQGVHPMAFKAFDYGVTIGGKRIVEGLVDSFGEVRAGGTKTVSLPITVNLVSVGETIFSAITGGSKLDFGLKAKLAVGTPFGDVPLSIDEKGAFRVER